MSQFQCDEIVLTTADSGPRNPHECLWGMIHTTEDPEGKDPVLTAKWQQNPANNSSYNVLVGHDGKTVRSNDDNYCPWSAGMPGNRLAIHISAIGRAARTRDDWFARPQQLESIARWAADLNKRYGIPLVWLDPQQVASRQKGFTSHGNYWQGIARAQGMDVRTDPGAGFPHDFVLARAAQIVKGEEPMSSSQADKVDLVLDQLAGTPWHEWKGWPQLGNRTLVDAIAAIGEKLGIDGFQSRG